MFALKRSRGSPDSACASHAMIHMLSCASEWSKYAYEAGALAMGYVATSVSAANSAAAQRVGRPRRGISGAEPCDQETAARPIVVEPLDFIDKRFIRRNYSVRIRVS